MKHFSEAALLAFEVAGLDDLREDIERLADRLYSMTEEGRWPSCAGKVAAEYRARRALAMPTSPKRRRAA
jgi:hypothetical protein